MNYARIYNNLVENAQSRQHPLDYYETHHIVPQSLGGNNDNSNLVELCAREHFIAHWLLYKIYQGTKYEHKMTHAWNMMLAVNSQQKRYTSHSYRYAKLAHSRSMQGDNNPAKRNDVRQAISKALTGQKKSTSMKRKVGLASTAEKCTFFKGYPVIEGTTYNSVQHVIDCGLAQTKSQVDYRMRANNWPNWLRSDKENKNVK